MFQPLAGQPFGGGHQRGFTLQVAHVGFTGLQALAAFLQGDHGFQHVEGGGAVVAAVQQGQGGVHLPAGSGGLGQPGGGQRHGGGGGIGHLAQGLEGGGLVAGGLLQGGQLDAGTRGGRGGGDGFFQQAAGFVGLAHGHLGRGLLTQVVGLPGAEVSLGGAVHLVGDGGGLGPVAGAFVDGQQGHAGFGLEGGAFQPLQGNFGAVQQAGLEEVEGQCVLGPLAVGAAEVAAREQVLVHAHGALVFTPAAEQVAQGEVQLRGVGVVLHGFDEGVDGLVLLLVEQVVEALEIGLGGLAVLEAQLTQVDAGGKPSQHEGDGEPQQEPAQVKVHAGSVSVRG